MCHPFNDYWIDDIFTFISNKLPNDYTFIQLISTCKQFKTKTTFRELTEYYNIGIFIEKHTQYRFSKINFNKIKNIENLELDINLLKKKPILSVTKLKITQKINESLLFKILELFPNLSKIEFKDISTYFEEGTFDEELNFPNIKKLVAQTIDYPYFLRTKVNLQSLETINIPDLILANEPDDSNNNHNFPLKSLNVCRIAYETIIFPNMLNLKLYAFAGSFTKSFPNLRKLSISITPNDDSLCLLKHLEFLSVAINSETDDIFLTNLPKSLKFIKLYNTDFATNIDLSYLPNLQIIILYNVKIQIMYSTHLKYIIRLKNWYRVNITIRDIQGNIKIINETAPEFLTEGINKFFAFETNPDSNKNTFEEFDKLIQKGIEFINIQKN